MSDDFLKTLPKLEKELGREGARQFLELLRQRAFDAEAQMHEAWTRATGDVPPESVVKLTGRYVRRAVAEHRDMAEEIRRATRWERVAGTSMLAMGQKKIQGGETTAELRKEEAEETRRKIVEIWHSLTTIQERNRAAVIAKRVGLTARQVREHLKKAEVR
ncbi:hypothetical protein [Thioalkalivibrio halophilus]|uniref:Uncharacterized protein n=1 Tax=Thioalkalivibrio halophilus TaxID=252474 RepID=A0A1V3A1Y0_9GAMM|nr:hypothetical protein [Thioalkalivibrio halophilus]OOC11332.1 hypothetical protein B1A74_00725 [Thioalkalivibrio halophilus]